MGSGGESHFHAACLTRNRVSGGESIVLLIGDARAEMGVTFVRIFKLSASPIIDVTAR